MSNPEADQKAKNALERLSAQSADDLFQDKSPAPALCIQEKGLKKPSQRYCKYCGHLIDSDTKKCTGCAKQYFHISLRKMLLPALIIAFIGSVGFNIYQGTAWRTLDNYAAQANANISSQNERIAQLEQAHTELEEIIANKNKEIKDMTAATKTTISTQKQEKSRLQQEIKRLRTQVRYLEEELAKYEWWR